MGLYLHQIDPVAISFFGFNIYWYSLSSFHNYIFQGMLDHFSQEAITDLEKT